MHGAFDLTGRGLDNRSVGASADLVAHPGRPDSDRCLAQGFLFEPIEPLLDCVLPGGGERLVPPPRRVRGFAADPC